MMIQKFQLFMKFINKHKWKVQAEIQKIDIGRTDKLKSCLLLWVYLIIIPNPPVRHETVFLNWVHHHHFVYNV